MTQICILQLQLDAFLLGSEKLNRCKMFSRHFVKTPTFNQYCYRPAPVSNSKSICFKIQTCLPSTKWVEELRTSQNRLQMHVDNGLMVLTDSYSKLLYKWIHKKEYEVLHIDQTDFKSMTLQFWAWIWVWIARGASNCSIRRIISR